LFIVFAESRRTLLLGFSVPFIVGRADDGSTSPWYASSHSLPVAVRCPI
jgi:hypothetical protein